MQRTFDIAVVGATGLVGREVLNVLAERGFPYANVTPLASSRSVGSEVAFGDATLQVGVAEGFDFSKTDIVLMCAGSAASKTIGVRAAAQGAYVIDNSSHFRMDADVPLVVPEVNAEAILQAPRRIIANPNCSTIQMVVALAPLCQAAPLARVVVSTYQAVSGRGQQGLEELSEQVTALMAQKEVQIKAFPKRIAFNCVPQIDAFMADGSTFEEQKMAQESRKILGLPQLGMLATCVRVPVFNGHALSVLAEFAAPMDAVRAKQLLQGAPGLVLQDDPSKQEYPTSIDAEGQDATFVGRLRDDSSAQNAIAFWCVADNLRKGAASNAVQIAELVAKHLGTGALQGQSNIA